MNSSGPQSQPTLRHYLKARRNASGLGLMIAAVLLLIFFHLMEIVSIGRGWKVWAVLVDMLKNGDLLSDHENLLAFSCLITLAIGALAGPLLIGWMFHNTWIKWSLAIFSFIDAAVMWYFAIIHQQTFVVVLALIPSLTLAGLLCIKTPSRSSLA